MIHEIVEASGIQFRETRFLQPPPDKTYGIWDDDVEVDGSDDGRALIFTHSITASLYEPKPDPTAEKAFESSLTAAGLLWTKQSRYWIAELQRYQVIYEFSYQIKIYKGE